MNLIMSEFMVNFGYIALILLVLMKLSYVFHVNAVLRLAITTCMALLALVVPTLNGYSIIEVLHGVVGDLSLTTIVILTVVLLQDVMQLLNFPTNYKIIGGGTKVVLLVLFIVLYLSVFGFIGVDVYSYGYYPRGMVFFVIFIELILWYSNRIFAIIWLLALVAFYFKLQPSSNLWDYLLDPVLLGGIVFSFLNLKRNIS